MAAQPAAHVRLSGNSRRTVAYMRPYAWYITSTYQIIILFDPTTVCSCVVNPLQFKFSEMSEVAVPVPGLAAPAEPANISESLANGTAAPVEDILDKYHQERDKRLRADGEGQYVDPAYDEKLRRYQADCWVTADTPNPGLDKAKNGDRYKVAIFGAGLGGILFAIRLIKAGIEDIVFVDSAGGFGGTWYWNRYPGLMCDVESYIYLPLLEEMGYIPKNKYSYGYEIREYLESIVDKYKLREKAIFRVVLESTRWEEKDGEWNVHLNRLDGGTLDLKAEIVISNTGLFNITKMPNLPGVTEFAGHSFHASRWDYEYTGGSQEKPNMHKLKNKRVGIIGTGATAVQVVPELSKWAKELCVFQRTPAPVDIRGQGPTDTEWFKREVQGRGKGWQRERAENFTAFVSNENREVNLVDDEWTRMRTFSFILGSPAKFPDISTLVATANALDLPRQEKLRKRVKDTVKDRDTAEKLTPWYPSWCKRPCFHDDYLKAFNEPNVTLVDTDGKGIDGLSKDGIVVGGKEYPLDVVIFSTGFYIKGAASPAGKGRFKAYGRSGKSLDDRWAEGVTTLHGFLMDDYPNFFMTGPNQAAGSANLTYYLDQISTHITYIITEASKRAKGSRLCIEATREAGEAWTQEILARAGSFAALAGCTPGYINGEGEMDKPKTTEEMMTGARAAFWGDGMLDYVNVIEKWRQDGKLAGLKY